MDTDGKELTAQDLWQLFEREYGVADSAAPTYRLHEVPGSKTVHLQTASLEGYGTGPIDAFVNALSAATGHALRVLDYHEHAVGSGAHAQAVAYLELRVDESQTLFGVGMDSNIVSASLKAILSGLRRAKITVSTEQAKTVPA